MKVLYAGSVITHYSHPLLEKVVEKGCELILLIPFKEDGNVGKGVKKVNDTLLKSYKVYYNKTRKKWYGKAAFADLKTYLLQEKPDILMMVWPYFLQLFFDRSIFRILKKQNIKLVIKEIPFQVPPFGDLNYFKENPAYNEDMKLLSTGFSFILRSLSLMYIRRYIYRRTDVALCHTSLAQNILPTYGIDKEAIFCGNTTDTESLFAAREHVLRKQRLLKEKQRILHIGRLVKWKRVDLLIEAFSDVVKRNPDSELVIIGDGPEKEALIKYVEKLELSQKIIFTGAIHDAIELGQYMYESSVYVLAGMGGLSINDAMCFSLPVICSVCDGTEIDLVLDGKNGLYFKQGDINSLIEKIEYILSNPYEAKKMGELSYEIMKNQINLDTISDKYIEAFKYAIREQKNNFHTYQNNDEK